MLSHVVAGVTRNVIGNLKRSNYETVQYTRAARAITSKTHTRSQTTCTSGCACAMCMFFEAALVKLCIEVILQRDKWDYHRKVVAYESDKKLHDGLSFIE